MKKKRLGKRAEISANVLVSLILLVLGFVIVLFVYYQISWTGQVDKEVCHESVILRATVPNVLGAQNLAALKCKTSKICVTSGVLGGKCEDDFETAKGITKVKVNKQEQIEKLISDEILDCWTMMGEGKVGLFSQYFADNYGLGQVYPTCVICSRIAFDKEKLEKKGITKEQLADIDIFDYMVKHKAPNNEISYYEYLAGEGGKISIDVDIVSEDQVKEEVGKLKEEIKEGNEIESDENSEEGLSEVELDKVVGELVKPGAIESEGEVENYEEVAILFMQVSSPKHLDSLKNLVLGTIGMNLAGRFATRGLSAKALATVPTWVKAIVGVAVLGGQQINVFVQRGVTAGKCGDVSFADEAREGCSVVRTVNYDISEIKKYCSVIESIN